MKRSIFTRSLLLLFPIGILSAACFLSLHQPADEPVAAFELPPPTPPPPPEAYLDDDELTPLTIEPLEEQARVPIPSEEPPVTAYDTVSDPDLAIVVTENRRLAESNRKLNTQLVDTLNWIVNNLKGKSPIPTHLAKKLALTSLNEEYLLHDDVLEYLNVSPREEEIVNQSLVVTRDTMLAVEDQLLVMTSPDPGRVVLRIPPYPEEGAILREELVNTLEYSLGEPRMNRLLGVAYTDLEKNFHHFGNAARTITFEHQYYEDDPYPQLVIRDAWVTMDHENRRQVQATSEVVDVVPDSYVYYVPWLPADFWVPLDSTR